MRDCLLSNMQSWPMPFMSQPLGWMTCHIKILHSLRWQE